MSLNFVDKEEKRSDWEDFHGHKKILGVRSVVQRCSYRSLIKPNQPTNQPIKVIGIVHCPHCESLSAARQEFSKYVQRRANHSRYTHSSTMIGACV